MRSVGACDVGLSPRTASLGHHALHHHRRVLRRPAAARRARVATRRFIERLLSRRERPRVLGRGILHPRHRRVGLAVSRADGLGRRRRTQRAVGCGRRSAGCRRRLVPDGRAVQTGDRPIGRHHRARLPRRPVRLPREARHDPTAPAGRGRRACPLRHHLRQRADRRDREGVRQLPRLELLHRRARRVRYRRGLHLYWRVPGRRLVRSVAGTADAGGPGGTPGGRLRGARTGRADGGCRRCTAEPVGTRLAQHYRTC